MAKTTSLETIDQYTFKVLGGKPVKYVNAYSSIKVSLLASMSYSGVRISKPQDVPDNRSYYIIECDFIKQEIIVPYTHELYDVISAAEIDDSVSHIDAETLLSLTRRLYHVISEIVGKEVFIDAMMNEMMEIHKISMNMGSDKKAIEIRKLLGL